MPLTRLIIKNFKSIKNCDISLSELNVLIGENGTGKTNLLDAISYFYRNLTDSDISEHVFDENNHYSNHFAIWFGEPPTQKFYKRFPKMTTRSLNFQKKTVHVL